MGSPVWPCIGVVSDVCFVYFFLNYQQVKILEIGDVVQSRSLVEGYCKTAMKKERMAFV